MRNGSLQQHRDALLVALGLDDSASSSNVIATLLEKLSEAVGLTLTRGEAFREWTVKNLQASPGGRSERGAQGPRNWTIKDRNKTRAFLEGCGVLQEWYTREMDVHSVKGIIHKRITDPRKRRTLLCKFSTCFNCLRVKGPRMYGHKYQV